jgi:hypothetical protein
MLNVEEGFANGGPLVRTFPATGNALLSGFYFQYVNDDNNLSRRLDRHGLQVMALPGFPSTAQIELGMHEEESDCSRKVGKRTIDRRERWVNSCQLPTGCDHND